MRSRENRAAAPECKIYGSPRADGSWLFDNMWTDAITLRGGTHYFLNIITTFTEFDYESVNASFQKHLAFIVASRASDSHP